MAFVFPILDLSRTAVAANGLSGMTLSQGILQTFKRDATALARAIGKAILPALVILVGCGGDHSEVDNQRLTTLVNLFTGTDADAPDFGTGGGAGNTYPGVVAPFGMLQWSPDTTPGRINAPGGYTYDDSQIRGFSLTHLSGVGCPIMQDIPFLPTTVPITTSPSMANSYEVLPRYLSSFDHTSEQAEPGYYRVVLNPTNAESVEVELSATTRTGIGRFSFPATDTASILMNAGGSAMANREVEFAIDSTRREVSGWVDSGQFCYQRNRYRVFFVAEFDRPFAAYGAWENQTLLPGVTAASDHADAPFQLRPVTGVPNPPTASNGAQAGAYVTFDTRDQQVVQARVAISYVSVENARENMQVENPGWDLSRVRSATETEWNSLLGRIQVKGGSPEDERTFYTMMYHALLSPNVFSDVNGQYMGMDGQVYEADGFTHYTTFSGWDIYRSQFPFLALLVPDRASDMVQSLLANARESGWLPKWSVASGHTDTMVGDPAAPIIASAYALGATDFDHEAALAALLKGATQEGVSANAEYIERQALSAYLQLGYVPHDGTELSTGAVTSMFGQTDRIWGSAATSLEYVTADFAIAQFAAALGDTETCEIFLDRSKGWRKLFNPETGFIQPRFSDGVFKTPFDPASLEGYVEGNGAQYTWLVPHDLAGLTDVLGGRSATTQRLDEFFTELNAGPEAPFAFLGNEPNAMTPWIYDWLGQPFRTQELVRRAILALYNDSPSGYPGNDDAGQMSAWYLFGALGFYPAIPGTDVLALGSPLFPEVSLQLPGGTLTIVSNMAKRDHPYVQRLTVNGVEHTRPWIRFRDVRNGGNLVFDLAVSPDATWGSQPDDSPPSFGPDQTDNCTTSIEAG
jgi:predicted alpha-1,2-mannosidase